MSDYILSNAERLRGTQGGNAAAYGAPFMSQIVLSSAVDVPYNCNCTWAPVSRGYALKFTNAMCPVSDHIMSHNRTNR